MFRSEIKWITVKKPLPSEKQAKMAIGFTKYRNLIEPIEAEAHKLLGELAVPTTWFSLYKDYTRECVKALRKHYGKNPESLQKDLPLIDWKWLDRGLNQTILIKLKERVISVYEKLKS